jgi:hypothetical protein
MAMIGTNIPLFQGIYQLPIILDPIILDEGGDIEETLIRNNAKYHHNCRLLFNNTMLVSVSKPSPYYTALSGRNNDTVQPHHPH